MHFSVSIAALRFELMERNPWTLSKWFWKPTVVGEKKNVKVEVGCSTTRIFMDHFSSAKPAALRLSLNF